jgi:DinB superfamily
VVIIPDTKDWTWVLQRPCPECGLQPETVGRSDIAPALRQNAAEWVEVLRRPDVRERPHPDVWSPLEYACHVRDVFVVFDERLRLMRTQDDPLFPNWDQDATAVERRYREQDPSAVSADLAQAAEVLAGHFDDVRPEEWMRRGRRSDGAGFTIESLGRYLVHDPVHHLYDVTGR